MRGLMVGMLAAATLAGCATAPAVKPAAGGGDAQATWDAGQEAYLAWNSTRAGWRTTGDGLQARRISPAKPKAFQPSRGCTVTVNYEGRLINGGIFDSSFLRHEPATFPLGKVIKGWGEGVPMMRVGETWEFAIPAALAYRDRAIRIDEPGKTSIFKNSTLIFKIELLSLGDDCETAANGPLRAWQRAPKP
jgi:FKBP-type peptidyl-prolyl cis-trans isomerase